MTVQAQIKEVLSEGKVKAIANVLLDDSFLVRGVKIVESKSGLFISYPSRRIDDRFTDICFPLNSELRQTIKETVFTEYEKTKQEPEEKAE